MKHLDNKPLPMLSSLKQSITYLLLSSYLLLSCGKVNMRMAPIHSQSHPSTAELPALKTPSYHTKDYAVTFMQEAQGGWRALVEDSFSHQTYNLPVYQELDLNLNDLGAHTPIWYNYHIHVYPSTQYQAGKEKKGYVYVGSMGLKGGMKKSNSSPSEINTNWDALKDEIQTTLGSINIEGLADIDQTRSKIQSYRLRIAQYQSYPSLTNSINQVLGAFDEALQQLEEIGKPMLEQKKYNDFIQQMNQDLAPKASLVNSLQTQKAAPDSIITAAQAAQQEVEKARTRLTNYPTNCNKKNSLETLDKAAQQLQEIIQEQGKQKVIQAWKKLKEEIQEAIKKAPLTTPDEAIAAQLIVKKYQENIKAYQIHTWMSQDVDKLLKELVGVYQQIEKVEQDLRDQATYNQLIEKLNTDLGPDVGKLNTLLEAENLLPIQILELANQLKPRVRTALSQLENYPTKKDKRTSLEKLQKLAAKIDEVIKDYTQYKLLCNWYATTLDQVQKRFTTSCSSSTQRYQLHVEAKSSTIGLVILQSIFPDNNPDTFDLQILLSTLDISITWFKKQQNVAQLEDEVKEVKYSLPMLHLAALIGDLDLVQKILKQDTSTHLTTSTNQTVLHYVALAKKPSLALAEWLLQQGISISAMDSEGNTALGLAVEHGHLDLIKLLVRAGVTLEFKHMEVAIKKNHTGVIEYMKELLLQDFQAKQEAMRKQLVQQFETQLQEPLQQIQETLQIAPQAITPQKLADQWIKSMQDIVERGISPLVLPSGENSHTTIQQADELSQGILKGLKEHQDLLLPNQREELNSISVELLRPYTATLVREIEELQQLIENPAPEVKEAEVRTKTQPQEEDHIIVQQQDSSSIVNIRKLKTDSSIEKRAVLSSKYYFITNFRVGNVNRIKQSAKRIKESLAKMTSNTLTDIQKKDLQSLFNKIQKEQMELATLYRDMQASISKREGDILFLTQDRSQLDKISQEKFQQEAQVIQKSIDNVAKVKELLLELKAVKEDLYKILINKKLSLVDYSANSYESNFENDYSKKELLDYLNSCGEIQDNRFKKAFIEVMRSRGKEIFALIMQTLGQSTPVSIQDLLELLHQVPQFDETILIENSNLKKGRFILDQRLKHITQAVLKIIIQSSLLPLERNMQITSLQEIKKRMHKLTTAIDQKIRRPILLLEYPKIKEK